jgi:hypothetical protein
MRLIAAGAISTGLDARHEPLGDLAENPGDLRIAIGCELADLGDDFGPQDFSLAVDGQVEARDDLWLLLLPPHCHPAVTTADDEDVSEQPSDGGQVLLVEVLEFFHDHLDEVSLESSVILVCLGAVAHVGSPVI